jgi:hypothetical protein
MTLFSILILGQGIHSAPSHSGRIAKSKKSPLTWKFMINAFFSSLFDPNYQEYAAEDIKGKSASKIKRLPSR